MGLERECCFGFGHMFAVKDISKRENVFFFVDFTYCFMSSQLKRNKYLSRNNVFIYWKDFYKIRSIYKCMTKFLSACNI